MSDYIFVTNRNEDDAMELPCEPDNTLLLSTLQAQYPKSTGLKYKIDNRFRALRLAEDKIYPPLDGWDDRVYYCVFANDNESSNTATKRTFNEVSSDSGSVQNTDLVVLGIPWSFRDEDLKNYFQQFGPLEFANVKTDKNTGKSKGFGFIRFTNHESALKAMLKRHKIGNRFCDVRIPESTKIGFEDAVSHKVFVGSLTQDITEIDLKEYFGQYGVVTEVLIPKPFREFAFVTFDSDSVARSLIGKSFVIKDTKVQVTEATPKRQRNNQDGNRNDYGRYDRNRSSSYGNQNQQDSNMYKRRRSDRDYHDWSSNSLATNGSSTVHPDVIQAVVSKAVSEVFNVQKAVEPWGRR